MIRRNNNRYKHPGMANAANRSWKLMLEKRSVDVELFVDLGKPRFIRQLASDAGLQGVRWGVTKWESGVRKWKQWVWTVLSRDGTNRMMARALSRMKGNWVSVEAGSRMRWNDRDCHYHRQSELFPGSFWTPPHIHTPSHISPNFFATEVTCKPGTEKLVTVHWEL